MARINYAEKLEDPRWQKIRLKIMERDAFRCALCLDDKSTLNVHHIMYTTGSEPWDENPVNLITLCKNCHDQENNRAHYEQLLLNKLKEARFFSDHLISLLLLIDDIQKLKLKLHNLWPLLLFLDKIVCDKRRLELLVQDFIDKKQVR